MSIRRWSVVWFFVCFLTPVLIGQAGQSNTSAVIAGTVVDSSGGTIPGATVTLEQSRKVLNTTTTDAGGRFSFSSVAAGAYTVRVSLQGFKTQSVEVSVVANAKVPVLKVVLDVGGMMETVTVSAGAPGVVATHATSMTTRSGSGRRDSSVTFTPTPQWRSRTVDDPRVEEYASIAPNPFVRTIDKPLSTFAADVDTASYTNVRRFLSKGQLPPADAVRIEELVNYFRFSYPEPRDGRPVSITTEVGDCPWAPNHKLALIGLRAKAIDDREAPPRNITLLLDVSGSMAPPERLPLIQAAMRMFVDTLRDRDRVAIVVYASNEGVALPATPGSRRQRIHEAIEALEAGGSTNGAGGIQLAYQLARRNFIQGGTNRVILATDGDFNVGITNREDLVKLIERERESGVFLSVLGVGSGNVKDPTMELLADKGNGHYAYLDSLQEARRVLVKEGGALLETVAKDVKFQVEFNPAQVAAYKLIGYENRLLADRDFNDDTKDAGDIGAGHTVTVLYEIVPAGARLPKELTANDDRGGRPDVDPLRYQSSRQNTALARSAELMTVKVRYKEPDAETSQLMEQIARPGGSAQHLSFAAAVAEFGLLLREDRPLNQRWTTLAIRAREAYGAGTAAEREMFAELVDTAAGLKRQRR